MENKNAFGEFMAEVVNHADQISYERGGHPLSDKYDSPSTIIKMIIAVSNTGWGTFKALSGLLANVSYFAFAAALADFAVSPIGLVVIGALVYWGGTDSIKQLYNNRAMVADVQSIGAKYELSYLQCTNDEEKKKLMDEAALDLYNL